MSSLNIKLTDDLLKQAAERLNEIMLEKFKTEEHVDFQEFVPSEKFRKEIAEIFENKRRRQSIRTIRTAIVIAAILAMIFACALSVSAVRQAISKFLFSYNADYAVVSLNPDTYTGNEAAFESKTEIEAYNEPLYIPDGFEEIQRIENKTKRIIYYETEDSFIVYRQEIALDSIIVDTEDAISNNIDINGIIGYYSVAEKETTVVWYNNEYIYRITSNLSIEEIITIAESIV